jgi:hypothetical protein
MQHDESELLDARSHANATARSTVVCAIEGLESAADVLAGVLAEAEERWWAGELIGD